MNIPFYSTITLIAEIVISYAILYSLYQGYKHNKFPQKIAAAALTYEVLFNITYMANRTHAYVNKKTELPWHIALAAFHGILSLIMFISLLVFFLTAWKHYRKGKNYFKEHKNLTIIFIVFWLVSVLSGVVFYCVEYLV